MLFLESELLRRQGIVHGFSVRTGGVSQPPYGSLNLGGAVGDDPAAVEQNRRRLFEAAGLDARAVATVNQVHGDRVVFARSDAAGVILSETRDGPALQGRVDADAVIACAGVAAGVRTADCVPILIHDPGSGASAAVHAGWRGTMAHIVARTVAGMAKAWGADSSRMYAVVGPAIGSCCFEVGPDLADRFGQEPSFGAEVVTPAADGSGPRIDLFRANEKLLLAAGLASDHIEILRRCTSCEGDAFFSHRRDKGLTGRHLSFIAARPRRTPGANVC